ncbi:MAG: hypothetical protein KKI12_08390 [Proteobacteria bacterium]|nr:hypothetical protein [Pseudomonadota bacterium]MBU4257980.1 hypothetical protein [Pseudomonadota bacterium]MBU4288173.1 hypothetical protein [Pseudomonadota bacterium]MCG2758958.1 hypothetical protein [Desulfobacteraceae bacterium]
MKKSEATLIGWLVVIGIIVYPFVWLHEKIGWIGIGLIGVIVVGFAIFYNISRSQKEQKTFDDLALYVLHNRLHPDEAKKMNLKLARSNFPRSALIRNLQIIRDSIEIALTSKKRDTAESRMNTLLERYEEIRKEQSGLVSAEVYNEIDRVIQETKDEFHTKLFLNLATGHMEKAQKLKTKKSKEKYLDLAIEDLKEGLQKGLGQGADLKRVLSQAEQAKANLE